MKVHRKRSSLAKIAALAGAISTGAVAGCSGSISSEDGTAARSSTTLANASGATNGTSPGTGSSGSGSKSSASGSNPSGSSTSTNPSSGATNDTSNPAQDPTLCLDTTPDPSAAALRRITKAQYLNAIRDIFDGKVAGSQQFPVSVGTSVTGFSTEADLNAPSQQNVEQVMNAAEEVAESTANALTGLLPCAAKSANATCAGTFIDKYARRAFRRTPTADERADLLAAFQGGLDSGAKFSESVAMLVDLMLQMPQFLYAIEDAAPTVRQLSGTEIATRLSFMLWDSIPDDTLLTAADNNQLATSDQVVAQAKRLLTSANADTTVARFIREWSGTEELSVADKTQSAYPYFTTDYANSLNQSFDRFAEDLLRNGGTLHDLLRSPAVFVDANMANFFGVSAPAAGAWTKVMLDDTRYTGVMTQPALLGSLAHSIESSYVFRGKFLRKRVLCTELGSPPANAQATFAMIMLPPNPTGKETSASVTARSSCSPCHSLMDPMGLAFEHFDGLGHYRDQYTSGRAIDPSGSVLLDSGETISFADQVELMETLSKEPAVESCFAKQVFRFTLSRQETDADACSVQSIQNALESSNGDIAGALVSVTTSDGFRYRIDQ